MLVKEVLSRRDELKNYLYALKRSITHCELYMDDEDMANHLKALSKEIQKEFDEVDNALKPFEELQM